MSEAIDPNQKREFRCSHCNGRIVIPADLPPTTGPCPHCGGVITSPAVIREAMPAVPVAMTPSAPVQPSPVPLPATHPVASAAPQNTPAVPPAAPAAADREASSKVAAKPAQVTAEKGGKLMSVLLVLLLLFAAIGAVVWFLLKRNPQVQSRLERAPALQTNDDEYVRIGWQKDAASVLRGYLGATSAQEKSNYVIGGKAAVPKIEEFYGAGKIDDGDTPAEAFSVFELSLEDRRRGLFMMIYDQPPQFELREYFRPLAPLEVQYGLRQADMLLASVANASNFAMEPVKVQAFFKRTPEGLKLDWDMFAQTKYRTLRNFVEIPQLGRKGVFRVFIVEDVPEEGKTSSGIRAYRVSDPGNMLSDTARINVKIDSEIGRLLSGLNWRGSKDAQPIQKTATLELAWEGQDNPQLVISRFVCWEFLGLGGEETTPADK